MSGSPASDLLNAVRVKRTERFNGAGEETAAQPSSCDLAGPLTDGIPEREEEFSLDDEILLALDNPDICSKYQPNGRSDSKKSVPAVVSPEESDDNSEEDNSEEEEALQGYMPLPQDSDEEPDIYDDDVVMVSRPDVGSDFRNQPCDMQQDVLCGAGGQDLGREGAAKPSELEEGNVTCALV